MAKADMVIDRSEIPENFNAASFFVDRNLELGRAGKIAFIDDQGSYSYGDLASRVNRAASALTGLGLKQEARVAMAVLDSIEFPSIYWGAIKAGIVPICLNTLLTTEHYQYILAKSRPQALVVSEPLLPQFLPILEELTSIETLIVDGGAGRDHMTLSEITTQASDSFEPVPTSRDDIAFWLNSSGSTGSPKGVRHRHESPYWVCRLYGEPVLGVREDDTVFSAAKLFFAYGLGNANFMPLYVGATAVLMAERPTPPAVMRTLKQHNPTIFCGVPTLYAALLADPGNNRDSGSDRLRICISAGEALPEEVGKAWRERFRADILDGVGSTEMLHIFLSSTPDDVRYGTSGRMVPGYRGMLVDETGHEVERGSLGELTVNGPSASDGYWNEREKNLNTFVGPWTYTGDKYFQDDNGYFHYCGRSDDMFKSGGNWVSPFEVESALITHEKVLEAAVVPKADEHGNFKPRAVVVLKEEGDQSDALVDELQEYVKNSIEVWKYPRWVEFRTELPKTATGKIQRFKLRDES